MTWREVPGATKVEQAVRVAGAFAECGVQEIVLSSGADARRLSARDTDLPGVLGAAQAGSVLEACGVQVEVGAAGLRWRVVDAARAETIAAALG